MKHISTTLSCRLVWFTWIMRAFQVGKVVVWHFECFSFFSFHISCILLIILNSNLVCKALEWVLANLENSEFLVEYSSTVDMLKECSPRYEWFGGMQWFVYFHFDLADTISCLTDGLYPVLDMIQWEWLYISAYHDCSTLYIVCQVCPTILWCHNCS